MPDRVWSIFVLGNTEKQYIQRSQTSYGIRFHTTCPPSISRSTLFIFCSDIKENYAQHYIVSCKRLLGDLVNGLSKTLDVVGSNTSDRYTSIHSAVHTVFLRKLLDLLGLEAGIAEHTDLGCDMLPVVLRTKLLEVLLKKLTHLDDALSHTINLLKPLRVELRVVQDLGSNAGTVDGGIGVQGAII